MDDVAFGRNGGAQLDVYECIIIIISSYGKEPTDWKQKVNNK